MVEVSNNKICARIIAYKLRLGKTVPKHQKYLRGAHTSRMFAAKETLRIVVAKDKYVTAILAYF